MLINDKQPTIASFPAHYYYYDDDDDDEQPEKSQLFGVSVFIMDCG